MGRGVIFPFVGFDFQINIPQGTRIFLTISKALVVVLRGPLPVGSSLEFLYRQRLRIDRWTDLTSVSPMDQSYDLRRAD